MRRTEAAAGTGAAETGMAALQRAELGQMAWASAALMETLTALGNEAVAFASARIGEDLRFQQELLGCRDLAAAQQLQAEFVAGALRAYTAQAGRMMQLGAGVAAAALPGRAKDNDPL